MQKVATLRLLHPTPKGQSHELFFRFMLKKLLLLLKFKAKKKVVKETEDLIWIRTFIIGNKAATKVESGIVYDLEFLVFEDSDSTLKRHGTLFF